MLARLDRAISDFRYAPVPLEKQAVTEAIAFLEWLRDDNFTFLGMREFHYSGGAAQRHARTQRQPGLGILADPDVLVLRRGNEAVTTTPEIRAFLHGPDPLIVTKANAKSVVHRRIYLDYVGVKTYRPEGQAHRRTAHRRAVHLDCLHALGDEDPLSALEGRGSHRQVGLQSERSFRQGADQRAWNPIRATSCSRSPYRRPAQACRGDPGARRTAARARAGARRPVRPLRLGPRIRAARPLRQPRARAHRRLSEDGVRRSPLGLSIRPFPKAALRASTSSSAAPAARRRRSIRPSSRPTSATSCGPGRTRSPRRRRAAMSMPAADGNGLAFPGKLSREFLGGRGAARRRPHRRARRRQRRSPSIITATPPRGRRKRR